MNQTKLSKLFLRKRLFFSLLFAAFIVAGMAAQSQNYKTVVSNGQQYFIYPVKAGEGLHAVSREFGVSIGEIIKSNPGVEDGLKLGQQLLVPVSTENRVAEASIINVIVNDQQRDDAFSHTVSRGETLSSISRTYGVSVDQIKSFNPGLTANISAGQVIWIPQKKIVQTEVKGDDYQYHTIEPKENLYRVSLKYSVDAEDIIEANPGLSVATFSAGKTIRIPIAKVVSRVEEVVKPVIHKVGRGETLFSIGQKYGVSVRELEEKNSITAQQLKNNMELEIPVKVLVEREGTIANEIDADRLLSQIKYSKKPDVINVGLLLPFKDETNNQHLRLQEYYEGLMMAVEKMQAKGANIDLFVFETGSRAKLESLLGTMEMESLDLLIGGMTDEQIKIMSDFSMKHNIKYVVPFSSRNNEVLNNGNIFQVNTPHSYLYSKASAVFVKEFADKNIILVNAPGKTDKTEFVATLKADLNQMNVLYSEVNLDENFEEGLAPLLNADKDNIIVPTTGDSGILRRIISTLTMLREDQSEMVTHLFGYPEWQTFEKGLTDVMHSFGTYFYSTFYVDEGESAVEAFRKEFKDWYNRDLLPTHPRYALFGYDTGMFFINAIYRNGVNFEERIGALNSSGLQFAFNFERVNNWSGFINTGLYLIHLDKHGAVFKMDKSR